jgi:hypothetical protein
MKLKSIAFIFLCTSMHTPSFAQQSFVCKNGRPTLEFKIETGKDAGKPGLLWIAAHTPDRKFGYFLTMDGTWSQYTGGLYPPYVLFNKGIPSSFPITLQLPQSFNTHSTEAYLNWEIYAGYGNFEDTAETMVKKRREIVEQSRSKGTLPPDTAYNSDEIFKWSLVQKDAVDNGKYFRITIVPLMDCSRNIRK